MPRVLVAAGLYNLIWGTLVILFPTTLFRWAGMELPRYPQIWQCVGMIVGVYGVGYLIAARSPLRHWPIVLVGLLGKVFGPIGFLGAALNGDLPWSWGVTILTNDLIWWMPFSVLLYRAFRFHSNTSVEPQPTDLRAAMANMKSQRGSTLAEISAEQPVLVVFLRHAGCTFCRESLAELAGKRRAIESRGVGLALIHMSPLMQATKAMTHYGLDDLHRFSDPECRLYRAFGLERAGFGHLFGPRIWWPAFRAAVLKGHGFGWLAGDGFRSHGAFVLHQSEVRAAFRPTTAAHRPDYVRFACDGSGEAVGSAARQRDISPRRAMA